MILYHTPVSYVATASASAVGRPPSNLESPMVARPWMPGGIGPSWWIRATGISTTPVWPALQGVSENTTVTSMAQGTALPPAGSYSGSLPLHADAGGRRKGIVTDQSDIALGSLNIQFNLSTFAGESIGALYLFSDALTLPDALLNSDIRVEYPQSLIELPNGVRFPVDQGIPRTRITLRWRRPRAQDLLAVARIARQGICWLDLQNPDQPGWQWPVRCITPDHVLQIAAARQDEATIEFLEVA